MTFWLDKMRKSLALKIYREKDNNRASEGKEVSPDPSAIDGLTLRHFFSPVADIFDSQTFRIYASTWNVGGRSPHIGLNLNDFIPDEDESDIYVLGFQEIVPLNAGNVLVVEDNEPAAKWVSLVDQALNRPAEITVASCPSSPSFCAKSTSPQLYGTTTPTRDFKAISSTSSLFQKPSFNSTIKAFRRDQAKRLRACNCPSEVKRKNYKTCFRCPQPYDSESENDSSEEEEEEEASFNVADTVPAAATLSSQHRYRCIVSKQMVGIFVTVWAKKEIVQHISHLQISCVGRGIMGRLGNKGCISVSMSLHQSTFCFICSHLASGQKEGDELRRNSDVIQILKNTRFRRICKNHHQRNPKRILDHDRVIWLGDLNYRIALSYSEARTLLEQNNWDALLEKDQLRIEREAGRVFKGWKEGKIYFPPTYKYSNNSDSYMGENTKSKSKRRTPAWCDRILWHGDGIAVLFYIRGESRLSDHRPVFAVFAVDVDVLDDRFRKELSASNMKVGVEELLPSS